MNPAFNDFLDRKESSDQLLQVDIRVNEKHIERHSEPITRAFICKKLTETTAPLFGVAIVKTAEIVVMAILVSKLGKEVLAADGLVSTYPDFLMQSTLAFFNPISPMVTEEFERKNLREVGKIVKQGWILAGVLSIPITTMQFFSEEFFRLIGEPVEITDIIGNYARVSCFAIPALFGTAVDYNFLKATKKEKVLFPFYLMNAGMGAGIFYLLTNGVIGFPKLGYTGLGYTILIQSWLTFLGFKIYFCRAEFERYRLFEFSSQNLQQFKRLLKLGSHLYLLSIADLGTSLTIGIMTSWLSVTEMAINQAASSYLKFSTALIDGIRQASQIHVSRFKSVRDYTNMQHFGNMGIFLEGCTNLIPLVFMVAIPMQMCNGFIDENLDDYESTIRMVFAAKGIAKIFEAMQGASIENLKGIFDTKYPALAQLIVSLSLILPMTYIMGFVFDLDLVGISLAASLGLSASAPIFIRRWYTMSHNEKYLNNTFNSLIETHQALPNEYTPILSLSHEHSVRNSCQLLSSNSPDQDDESEQVKNGKEQSKIEPRSLNLRRIKSAPSLLTSYELQISRSHSKQKPPKNLVKARKMSL